MKVRERQAHSTTNHLHDLKVGVLLRGIVLEQLDSLDDDGVRG